MSSNDEIRMNRSPRQLPYLTHPLRGIGGRLKTVPEDFIVDEIPAYEPCGEGEHLFVKIEKRGLTTQEAIENLARHCGISPNQVSSAGLKDKESLSRQTICLPVGVAGMLPALDDPRLRILSAVPHRNKLKTGHLRGNRFEIVLRGVDRSLDSRAEELREWILRKGFPNYFGEQRFGFEGSTARQGFELMHGGKLARNVPYSRRKFLTRLSLSAAQSELFNRCLARRIKDELIFRVLPGDVMQVVKSGGLFVVEDAVEDEQQRFDAGATAVTGPIFGPKMTPPREEPALREETVLLEEGLSHDDFRRFAKLTMGTRRPYLVRVAELEMSRTEHGLRFRFELPKGTYATSLLRELMKTSLDSDESS
jgi:tRNA pseudouridine13 synthase